MTWLLPQSPHLRPGHQRQVQRGQAGGGRGWEGGAVQRGAGGAGQGGGPGGCGVVLQKVPSKANPKVCNHGEGPSRGLLLVESGYYRFHI